MRANEWNAPTSVLLATRSSRSLPASDDRAPIKRAFWRCSDRFVSPDSKRFERRRPSARAYHVMRTRPARGDSLERTLWALHRSRSSIDSHARRPRSRVSTTNSPNARCVRKHSTACDRSPRHAGVARARKTNSVHDPPPRRDARRATIVHAHASIATRDARARRRSLGRYPRERLDRARDRARPRPRRARRPVDVQVVPRAASTGRRGGRDGVERT